MKNSEVVMLDSNKTYELNPDTFEGSEMSLSDFSTRLTQTPSLGFRAYQRLYAALRMFGRGEEQKPWNIPRWNFLDYPINEGARYTYGAIYGQERAADNFIKYLNAAILDPALQAKTALFYGPTATGKTNIVKIMSDTLDLFGTKPQGEMYTVQFDVSDYKKHFGGLTSVRCPAHETPLNFMQSAELHDLLADVNESLPKWQHIQSGSAAHRCPSCSFVTKTLRDNGVSNMSDLMSVVKLSPFHDVRPYEVRPKNMKSFNSEELFGGNSDLSRAALFGGFGHPLTFHFGRMGGMINSWSSQRHLTTFSEMYKNPEETKFLDSLLDVIQDRIVMPNNFPVQLDTVMVGTTNLGEYEKARNDKSLAEYLQRRIRPFEMSSILVIDDLTRAVKNRVYGTSNGVHIPPRFVEKFLSPLGVLSALDEPASDLKVSLLQKAKVYNGEMPHGIEKELQALHEELLREAHNKPFGKKTEGIYYGVPFSFFQDLKDVFESKVRALPASTRDNFFDKDHEDGCISLLPIEKTLEDLVARYDGINDATRLRITEEALGEAMNEYKKSVVRDVRRAIIGDATLTDLSVKYITQSYAEVNGRNKYLDARGLEQHIDSEFLSRIEKASGVSNPKQFRQFVADNLRYRQKDMKNKSFQKNGNIYAVLAKTLLEEDSSFRRAMEEYAQSYILPAKVSDITVLFSESNNELITTMKSSGYCKACVSVAIGYASEARRGVNHVH